MQNKYQYPNDLVLLRQRMRLTQDQVCLVLGKKEKKWLYNLELGRRLPTLMTALRLAILYRVPVDFLYRDLYIECRDQIRKREEQLPTGRQGVLFGGSYE